MTQPQPVSGQVFYAFVNPNGTLYTDAYGDPVIFTKLDEAIANRGLDRVFEVTLTLGREMK